MNLQDAVPLSEKDSVRDDLPERLSGLPVSVFVRIIGVGTPWLEDYLNMLQQTAASGVMLSRTETADELAAVDESVPVIDLVETARGFTPLPAICEANKLRQLAFGSIDYALDLSGVESHDALLLARPLL